MRRLVNNRGVVMRHFPAIAIALLLAGCAHVQSNITTFHVLPTKNVGKTVAIFPGNSEDQSSLERKAYVAKLAQHFESVGYHVVDYAGHQKPDYVAIFAYGIDSGTPVTESYAIPQWGVTGYSGAVTTGTINTYGSYGTYSGTTTVIPQYGITGYSTGTTTSTEYNRAIVLALFDTAKIVAGDKASVEASKVYESKLISHGRCGSMAGVMDTLLDALFQDFPGESGKARTVDIPTKASDC